MTILSLSLILSSYGAGDGVSPQLEVLPHGEVLSDRRLTSRRRQPVQSHRPMEAGVNGGRRLAEAATRDGDPTGDLSSLLLLPSVLLPQPAPPRGQRRRSLVLRRRHSNLTGALSSPHLPAVLHRPTLPRRQRRRSLGLRRRKHSHRRRFFRWGGRGGEREWGEEIGEEPEIVQALQHPLAGGGSGGSGMAALESLFWVPWPTVTLERASTLAHVTQGMWLLLSWYLFRRTA